MKIVQDPLYVEDEFPVRDDTARSWRARSLTGHTRSVLAGGPAAESYRSYLLVFASGGARERQERFNVKGQMVNQWTYDREGRPLEETVYGESGELNYRFEFVYEGACWKERRMIDAQGRLNYRIVGDREGVGRLSEATFYAASGEVIRSDRYFYNDLGQLTLVDMGLAGSCEWEYDDKNNLLRRSKNLPGASIFGDVDEFEHDDHGLIKKSTHLHGDETSFTWAFFG